MFRLTRFLVLLVLLASTVFTTQIVSGLAVPAFASGGEDDDADEKDDDKKLRTNRKLEDLRDDVRQKNLLPLSRLKAIVVARYGNSIIEIETEKKRGRWQYEFKLISRKGRLLEVYVDGHTGRIIRVEND